MPASVSLLCAPAEKGKGGEAASLPNGQEQLDGAGMGGVGLRTLPSRSGGRRT
jgi:hypothetical protein